MTQAIQNLFLRAIRILFYSDLHATRFTLGLAELIWAFTLLWPGDTFGRPTYTIMASVMHENAWGLLFLVTAIMQFTILLRGDYHSRFSCYFAAWNMCFWGYTVMSMYFSVSPPPAAISGEAALAVAAGWVWVRSGYVSGGRRSTDYERSMIRG